MKILQLTVHFSPNLGGVETHLDDLVAGLAAKKHNVFVLTYRPLSVSAEWQMYEHKHLIQILRIPWIPGFFNMLSTYPILEFIYLFPGLFVALLIVIFQFRPQVIHAHGLVSGLIAVFWGKIFNLRTVVSTHSIYNFPSSGIYRSLAIWLFSNSSHNLCLSDQSTKELVSLGIPASRVSRFTYWGDLERVKPQKKPNSNKIIVLFVGRRVPEKGIPELLAAAEMFKPGITLQIAGSGPLEASVKKHYIGRISQSDLPYYYSTASVVIVPSTHDEGFGRVIIESLACGTPVVAANRGAIPEAMDNTVGKLIDISPQNIQAVINYLFTNQKIITKMKKKARVFATKRYSYHNIDQIIDSYHAHI